MIHTDRTIRAPVLLLALLGLSAAPSAAQEVLSREGYLRPPAAVEELVLAPWHRNAELEAPSPDGRWFVAEVRERAHPPLSVLAREHHHLGGLQVDPAANRNRDLTTDSPDGFRLVSAEDGREVAVESPAGAPVSTPIWSQDGSRLAFFVHRDDATHIYVADPATGSARRITPRPVLATLAERFDWSGDGRHVFAVLVPEDRGPEPEAPVVPGTPRVDLTTEGKNELRTYPDLLETPHERALLEYYGTGQLVRIGVETGEATPLGAPGLIDMVDASPDGRWVRVRTLEKPFPGIVPVRSFARTEAVWSGESGEEVAVVEREPADVGTDAAEDEEEAGPRETAWLPGEGGLAWLEREAGDEDEDGDDDEDEEEDEDRMDRIMRWPPPFDSGGAVVVFETEGELEDLAFAPDGQTFFVWDEGGGEDDDLARLLAIPASGGPVRTVASHDTEDAWDDPGELVLRSGVGAPLARVSADDGSVYLEGTVYHRDPIANPPRPFLDRVPVGSGEAERLFESAPDLYERVEAVLDDGARRLVISRESPTDAPDWFLLEPASGNEEQLTDNLDRAPALTGAVREAVWATRADGLRFKVEVTLPADRAEDQALPALFWHYPREYEDEDDYREDIRDYNRNAFPSTRARNMEILVAHGYAVVDPDVPIVGSRELWNDLYVTHLRNSLAAAIDAVAAGGWVDRNRLAVGGHSYGGFGTLNAMIQTPFFKAGIAGSANSNRSLTPAGFQRERRILWEARETYVRMSPIFWMNELSGAVLLYHGLDDQNVGTFPDHSVRSFHALNALGKTAALYMYPYEAHGPAAEETLLDLWARWTAWLDRYVKDPDAELTEGGAVAEEASGG